MSRRIAIYLSLITLLVVLNLTVQLYCGNIMEGVELAKASSERARFKVVLVPLDSRPACTQFVQELGNLANMEVIIPPKSILDNYQTPANRSALRQWLLAAASNADMAIVAADMLIHGGLLASRVANGDNADVAATLDLLTQLHLQQPQLKTYVFSIIPRLLLADNDAYVKYQQNVLKYSVLQDQLNIFENPRDLLQLQQLKSTIPPEVITKYQSLYTQNTNTSLALISLVEKGIITGLVLGQDDSQPFGLPNSTKQLLTNYLSRHAYLSDKVKITRGTDEVALTLLGQITMQANRTRPKICVRYSHPAAPYTVMPYMPHSVARTVQEKVELINGLIVASPEAADFVLYIHIGSKDAGRYAINHSAASVNNLLQQGYKVALVDLSEDFSAAKTLLPRLIEQNVNILQLISYAGWNTTSNSVGTALTQAAVFTSQISNTPSEAALLALYQKNLEFLTARFLDDWYYQKNVQPIVDQALTRVNVNRYNLKTSYGKTNKLVQRIMQDRKDQLYRRVLSHQPITITAEDRRFKLAITGIELECYLPWERTFEIWLKPNLTLSLLNS